jgi:hypothetical protein
MSRILVGSPVMASNIDDAFDFIGALRRCLEAGRRDGLTIPPATCAELAMGCAAIERLMAGEPAEPAIAGPNVVAFPGGRAR